MDADVEMEFDHVIYVHIPKAAGNTLRAIAYRNYPIQSLFMIPGDVHRGIKDFEGLSEKALNRIRFMKGHVPYGLHRKLPGKCSYMTILRDPISRVTSFWRYVRGSKTHALHRELQKFGDISEFLDSELTVQVSNLQTIQISGGGLASSTCTEDDYREAERNLRESFTVVGLVEEFEATVALCCAVYGWQRAGWKRLNVSAERPSDRDRDEAVVAKIRELNRYDIRLYEVARELFEAQRKAYADEIGRVMESPEFTKSYGFGSYGDKLDKLRTALVMRNSKRILGWPMKEWLSL